MRCGVSPCLPYHGSDYSTGPLINSPKFGRSSNWASSLIAIQGVLDRTLKSELCTEFIFTPYMSFKKYPPAYGSDCRVQPKIGSV